MSKTFPLFCILVAALSFLAGECAHANADASKCRTDCRTDSGGNVHCKTVCR